MIDCTDKVLTEALSHYAVLFNRAQWLDPSRTTAQLAAWRAMIKAQGHLRGQLMVDDFTEAIYRLQPSERPTVFEPGRITSTRDVNPPHIIAIACDLAVERRERARIMLMQAADPSHVPVHEARARWHTARQREGADLEAVDWQYRAAILQAQTDLRHSGFDKSEYMAVLERVVALMREIADGESPALT